MLTGDTLEIARETAAELRRRGETERATAIEALIEAAVPPAAPAAGDDRTADLVGVDGATLRRWLREGRYNAYRIGPVLVPVEIVAAYARRAGASLDLEAVSDEEAVHLVAE